MKIAETCPAGVKGMCVANAHLMQVSLNLNDTPVGYAPPVGPAVYFQLSYNHRGATSYAPLGPQWSHNFLAYINGLPAGEPINLIGHSYGGDTAARVAACSSRKIDNLVTVDPVSRFGVDDWYAFWTPSYQDILKNVGSWRNYNNIGGSSFEPSNLISDIGGYWGSTPGTIPGIHHENAPYPHYGFGQIVGPIGY